MKVCEEAAPVSWWRHTGSEEEAQGGETPAGRRRGCNSPKQATVSGESCSGRGSKKLLTVTRVVVNQGLTAVWVIVRCFHVEVARLLDLDRHVSSLRKMLLR